MPRYANNVDDNQADIVAAWRDAGASVLLLHSVGKGCPDTLVGFRGDDFLVEIIGTAKLKRYKKNGGLADNQVEWHRDWRGSKVYVVKSVTEALAVLGIEPVTDIEHRGKIGEVK